MNDFLKASMKEGAVILGLGITLAVLYLMLHDKSLLSAISFLIVFTTYIFALPKVRGAVILMLIGAAGCAFAAPSRAKSGLGETFFQANLIIGCLVGSAYLGSHIGKAVLRSNRMRLVTQKHAVNRLFFALFFVVASLIMVLTRYFHLNEILHGLMEALSACLAGIGVGIIFESRVAAVEILETAEAAAKQSAPDPEKG